MGSCRVWSGGSGASDAGALVGHLVAEGSMFAFLAAHRQECLRICSLDAGGGLAAGDRMLLAEGV
jgi:hypothetical protein